MLDENISNYLFKSWNINDNFYWFIKDHFYKPIKKDQY